MDKTSNKYCVPCICLALVLAILAVYWQVLFSEFVTFDDPHYVSENQYVRTGFTRNNIIWAFTPAKFGYWHPLTWLSHMMDCQLYGLKPGLHHLSNLLIHTANSLLLFLVFRRMTGAVWRSAFVAAVFALHPVNVESVAWVTGRKNVLSTLFWLFTMWAYTGYVCRGGLLRYAVTLLLFALGLLAKPMLVTLPFVLLLLDYWPFGRFQPEQMYDESGADSEQSNESAASRHQRSIIRRLILEKVPFFALSVVSVCVSSLSAQRLGMGIPMGLVPVGLRIENAIVSYVRYLDKMILPRKLAVFYPYPDVIPLWQSLGAALFLVSATYVLVWALRPNRYSAVGWLWYVGTLVPVIGLVQAGLWPAIADRWMYVPMVGLTVLMAWGIPALLAKWRYRNVTLGTAALMVLLALSVCTGLQVSYWRSSITLFQHTIGVTNDNYQAHFSMIKPLRKQGRIAQAIEHGYKALKINPDYPSTYNSLGAVLIDSGELDGAIAHLRKAIKLKPDFPAAHVNLGAALFKQGDLDEATRHFYKALQLKPDSFGAHINLATVFTQQGEIEKAIKHYTEAIRINPDFADGHNSLGYALVRQGRFDEAVEHYTEALRINPDFADAHNNLGYVLAQQGRLNGAIRHYAEALRIGPESAGLHNDLGVALARQGKIDKAVNHFEAALRIEPDSADIRRNLNAVLAFTEQDGATGVPEP
jgi:tetratricopeptide (TPR) repeat protein